MPRMFNRRFMHLYLILMFAFAQAGIIVHDISHVKEHQALSQITLDDSTEQNQESDLAEEKCVHCIAFEESAHAAPTADLQLTVTESSFHFATVNVARLVSRLTPTYSARAPPVFLS